MDATPGAEQGVRAGFGHIGAIEGLRGIAVLWVIGFHYVALRAGAFQDPWVAIVEGSLPLLVVLKNGHLGVDLFFLITGFLLILPWVRNAREGAPPPSTRAFYRRRVRRIVPAYYLHLALLFAVLMPVLLGPDYWRRNLWTLLYNIAAHFSFLHYFTPISSNTLNINGALWTLSLEFQFYLLLPLVAPLFVRAPWRTAFALVASALAWRWLAAFDLDALVRVQMRLALERVPEPVIRHLVATQLPGYLAHFAVGMLAGRAWLLMSARPAGRRESALWATAAAIALGALYVIHQHIGPFLGEMTWIAFPLALGLALFALVSRAPALARPLLANAPLAFVGRVSYSAYLYHLPLLLLWNRVAGPEAGWAAMPAYLALTLATAWLSYRFVERPFLANPQADKSTTWQKSAAPGASEVPRTSSTTIASGAARSTTTGSSSSS